MPVCGRSTRPGSPEPSVASNDPAQAQPERRRVVRGRDRPEHRQHRHGRQRPSEQHESRPPALLGRQFGVCGALHRLRPTAPAASAAADDGRADYVTTGSAGSVTSSSATVSGSVNPNGLATSYHFQYGTSTSYGSSTTAGSVAAVSSAVAASAALSGLAPGTTYHYRLVASNADGATNGADKTFTTASAPPPAPPLKVSLTGLKQSYARSSALRRGIPVGVGCNQACTIQVTLTAGAPVANRLHKRAPLQIASKRGALRGTGTTSLALGPNSLYRRALATFRVVKLSLKVVVTSTTTGKRQTISRTLSVKA